MKTAAELLTFHHVTLPNGLTVIGEHNPEAKSVAAGFFVDTGARDERPEIAGVSHFLEHMTFKGTARRSAEAINREFDELGANYNAYTSEEHTVYYGAVLRERGERLLELLADMMRPSLREADFALEQKVILEEIAMYQDRPSYRVFDLGVARYFRDHPLGHSVLGSTTSVGGLTPEAMRNYFEARYAPDNMVLALAGNYDWERMLAQITELSAAWRPAKSARSYPPFTPSSGLEGATDPALARAHVAIYAPGVSAQDPRRYAAAVLATCLGDSSGSRLYWALVDKGLAESASLTHDGNDRVGAFVGYLATAPEQVGPVLEAYLATLRGAETGLNAEEWARAQRKLATALTLHAETPFGRLMSLGSSYLYTREYASLAEVVGRVFSATIDDAMALLAERPFSRPFAFTLRP